MNTPVTRPGVTSLQPQARSMKDIATMPKDRQFPAMLQTLQGEIKRALPGHLNPDRMARIALTCFRTTPALAECDPASVFAAVLQSAQLGLEPGLLGQAYLIPFNKRYKDDKGKWQSKKECQLIVGYQGLVDLARRTGRILSLEAHMVYEKDRFELEYGLTPKLVHVPQLDGDRGQRRLVYAVAHLKDGGTHVEVMSRAQVETIRDRSEGYKSAKQFDKSSPWDSDTDEMWRKTVLRRISKFLPKSVELAQAVALDHAAHAGRSQDLNIDDAIEGTWTPVDAITDESENEATESKGGGMAALESEAAAAMGQIEAPRALDAVDEAVADFTGGAVYEQVEQRRQAPQAARQSNKRTAPSFPGME